MPQARKKSRPRKRRKSSSIALGHAVRWRREERGWSQEELAHRAKLHPTYIGGTERGERNITIESLLKVAVGLEMPASKLLADAEGLMKLPRRQWPRPK